MYQNSLVNTGAFKFYGSGTLNRAIFAHASWSDGVIYFDQGGVGSDSTRISASGGTLTTWNVVDLGQNWMVAVQKDGTLWAWGNNSQGQLGLGNITTYSSPKQVGILTNWYIVSSGNFSVNSINTSSTLLILAFIQFSRKTKSVPIKSGK
jgi:hypothetical protein